MGAGRGEVTRELPNVEDLCNSRQVADTYNVIFVRIMYICISTNHVCRSNESTSKTGVKLMVGIPTNTQDFTDRKTKAVYLGGEGLSLSAMAAYQSARLLPSWENAAFRICVQVARVGAAASPGSVTSRLLEGHVTGRWCNESS